MIGFMADVVMLRSRS